MDFASRAMAIVGVGAVLPEAPNVKAYWDNLVNGRDCIREVPPERWNPVFYYDSDRNAPDKTYSKIGGWVRQYEWDPMKWKMPLPPKVVDAMDESQKWVVACTREALEDYGYPNKALDPDRTAVIIGNAMGGEMHYLTALRVYFPDFAHEIEKVSCFAELPNQVRTEISRELQRRVKGRLPGITEDSMPGELSNCLAGRIANLYNLRGPNYSVDAACASAMAALTAAVAGLASHEYDLAITGGIDRNMGPSTFVKFSKIGALSARGSSPYAAEADGFVMGEGGAVLLVKRLADAERDGDKIYAVLRGIAGSSDGKGKGITAPNPVGQKLCITNAWKNAGESPATATMFEGHGTSTRVGDAVEAQSLIDVLRPFDLAPGSVALGSVKSNIGHLKAAASAAGLLKTVLSLKEKVIPPSLHCEHPNPEIDFARSPLFVNTALRPWNVPADKIRRAGVSAFGFGGTNFHAVLEEHIPGRLTGNGKRSITVDVPLANAVAAGAQARLELKKPLRGALVVGAANEAELIERLRVLQSAAEKGSAPTIESPNQRDLRAPERIAIDYADAPDLAQKISRALNAFTSGGNGAWKVLRSRGIFRGTGPAQKTAFLYTGQGSQYVNMLKALRANEKVVSDTFAEADVVLTPLLGKPLTDYIFVDHDASAIAKAEEDLKQTAITQPAVLTVDVAITRLLALYGIEPDMTIGHSLGEYGALVAAGALDFAHALEAVSARGREMTRISVSDNGKMAAIFAPLEEVQDVLQHTEGYVVIANINSEHQAVIGGATSAVEHAVQVFKKAGHHVAMLPVSHAFHTSIVAPASVPLRKLLERLTPQPPRIPVIANVTGEFYPSATVEELADILAQQVASPVQFVKGIQTLYAAGARVFVESGPKRALHGFVEDILSDRDDAVALFTNSPKDEIASFNQALCGLYAAGLGAARAEETQPTKPIELRTEPDMSQQHRVQPGVAEDRINALGRLFADFLERGWEVYRGESAPAPQPRQVTATITGAAIGLPGTERIFDDSNVERMLRGDQFITAIPTRFRQGMLDKNVTRLVKSEQGGPKFESIDALSDVIKLAGRGGAFDAEEEFGIDHERLKALDRTTRLAIAAGIDALRDAGIPLVMRYKTTSKGTRLPERWGLPDELRDDTGVIFACAFPGYDALLDEVGRYYNDRERHDQLAELQSLRARVKDASAIREIDERVKAIQAEREREPYVFDRRYLFKTLSMGHSQFAEYIGARGPNQSVNTACASTTGALTLAEDWLKNGRCRRVIIVSADDVTSDHMLEWIGAGFLATGAAATDERVEDAALPFDRRRHGMLIGMGAVGFVIETKEAARERGIQPICEIVTTVSVNSAFHGTRLDVEHICGVMETLLRQAEQLGISRAQIAPQTVFVSHETYTPARGGSASAEINALRRAFGSAADQIVIANTKGYTGHAMGAGIEDVLAVKSLETGIVPPVPNLKEPDPELGVLNLSKGGHYPVQYALRLAAGFGSQISMALLRWVPTPGSVRPAPNALGFNYRVVDQSAWSRWLTRVSGQPAAQLEVVKHTLRVKDNGAPAAVAAESVTVKAAPPVVATPTQPLVAAPVPVATASAAVEDPVKAKILAIVAEKTGYPTDMLDLDLDLEADLGVDTVKQAEVFAAVRESYGIERDENLRLRDFPTLAHVIKFVHDRRPDLAAKAVAPAPVRIAAPAPVPQPQPVSVPPVAAQADPVKERILALVVEKTGYPTEMLDLDLDLEADLGIDTVKQAELFAAVRSAYDIPRDQDLKLRDFPTLAHVIKFVYDRRPELRAQSVPVPAVAAAQPAVAPAAADASVRDKILDIVAEKTGYPKDMLDLDLDLEADLGIDTVKQAEMMASVRAAFGIERDENLKLRDFPTLAHVIRFAEERGSAATVGAEAAAAKAQPASTVPAVGPRPVAASFDAANKIPRRAPVPVLRPALGLCKATGVKLGKKDRVIVMPDQGGVAKALAKLLKARGVEVLKLNPAWDVEKLQDGLKSWLADGAVQGVYWLPAVDAEGDLRDLDAAAWHEGIRVRVKSLYATMRALYEQIAPTGTFFVSATRFGGQHGYDDAGAVAPMGGAVSGFTKAFKRERSDALVKAVDFEADRKPAEIAELLIAETLRDPGAVEIGYKSGARWAVGLQERAADDGRDGIKLGSDTVFLVTGAAGSIVSAITADLAAASGGTFYLLDLVPAPADNDPDIQRFISDKEGLKREIFARIQASGTRATPALVEKELASLERAHAAHSAIQAVRAAGGTAHYCSVNLLDADAVAKVIEQVRAQSGRIDVLLHAAGMERSHMLPDKEPREFDLVFDVKSHGWFNLLRAIGDMPLGATVAFSSVAGRFGNAGQTDYSSANDLLCKMASSFRSTRPATRAIAIDWTAWGGIGMATRGSIPKMMEVAGIDMLPPEAGIPLIRRELTTGGTRGEVVIGQRLGVMMGEFDANGGLDPDKIKPSFAGPIAGKISGVGLNGGVCVESTLDPKVEPFLHDHQIDGTPVLPGVMGIEAFAEAAVAMPGDWHVESLEDIQFLAPFKFYRNEPRTVSVEAMLHPAGDALLANCRLLGSRTLQGAAEPQVTTHFTGRVRLARQRGGSIITHVPGGLHDSVIEAPDIYRVYFHGPAYQVLKWAWHDGERMIGQMASPLPPNHSAPERPVLMSPRLIELCLQTAGLWEIGAQGKMGLPQSIERIQIYGEPREAGDYYAVVTPDPVNGSFNGEVVDKDGNTYLSVHGYRTVALPMPASDAFTMLQEMLRDECEVAPL